ncbi:hypothetical protein, partial [Endozoicomonas sp. YOMI1]|uniref:hypothetical protein n=1 Tax=Endozoicomonas sp. YOMI1 TaxID=2828739 RepID=UPI0021479FEA
RRRRGGGVIGTVAHTTAVYSHVTTEGERAYAGIGGGGEVDSEGTVAHTTAVNSYVTTLGNYSGAGIEAGQIYGTVDKAKTLNSFVNGNKTNSGSISYDQLLCQKPDLLVLTANCSPRTEFLDALNSSYSDACRVSVTTVSTATEPAAATESAAATEPAATTESAAATKTAAATEPTAASVSTAATESAAASVSTAATAGITTGYLVAAGVLVIVGYQWITGYRDGLRGQELAMKPLTRGKELASAAVDSVSQGIQGIRERRRRRRFLY